MTKKILGYIFISSLLLAVPASLNAAEMEWNAQETIDSHDMSITVEQSTIRVTGAAGKTLEIVSLTGRPVASIKIDSPSQRVELNLPKGCYILKIEKLVRKVTIR